jgi:hypothetical protein
MGVMTADAAELPSRPPPFPGPGHRMPAHRMAPLNTGQGWMTTNAEIIDRLVEHRRLVCSMRIMTGHASRSGNDAVDKPHGFFFVQKILFIAVAGNTERNGTFLPKLIPIFVPVRIMTYRTPPDIQGPVDMFTGAPFSFTGMAGKTGILDFALRKAYAPRLDELLMTCEAEFVYLGAVGPRSFGEKILVAGSTGFLAFNAH